MTLQRHGRGRAQRGLSTRELGVLFSKCAAGDARARERIIVAFLPYAHHLAQRYAGRGEPVDDLYQTAAVGLIKAVDRYRPDRSTSFVAYAEPTILGEIRRHFRDSTWKVHLPRSVQDHALQVAGAHEELVGRRGSEPTAKVIATHLGLGRGEVAEAQWALSANQPRSLDATHSSEDGDRLSLGDLLGAVDPEYDRVETRLRWRDTLPVLRPRERLAFVMRFGAGLSQSEIAKRIGVSQMHVSRIVRGSAADVAAALELG
ncbi:MAG: sigma-70 family RNA polymerase sigma factor [Solirubrobacteraceae bacterium]